MDINYSAVVLCNILKYKKGVMCLMEKIPVLDKLPFGMSYSAVGYEFNDNESII